LAVTSSPSPTVSLDANDIDALLDNWAAVVKPVTPRFSYRPSPRLTHCRRVKEMRFWKVGLKKSSLKARTYPPQNPDFVALICRGRKATPP